MCLKKSESSNENLYKNKKIPARYQYIEWRKKPQLAEDPTSAENRKILAAGFTDIHGDLHTDLNVTPLDSQFYKTSATGLCADIIVAGGIVRTQIRMRPLVPEGNTNWTSWINVAPFVPRSNKSDVLYVNAPNIKEKIRGNPFLNDKSVRRTPPLYATDLFIKSKDLKRDIPLDRIIPDPSGNKTLFINSARTPNTEGLHAYVSPNGNGYSVIDNKRDLSKIHARLNDNGGVIVLRSLDLKYDYESCADFLVNQKYPNAAWFGLNDCFARGMYSNTKIYVAKRKDVAPQFGNQSDICQAPVQELEKNFRNAIKISGGIDGGLIPGYFWSGNTTLSEQFNAAHSIGYKFDSKRYSVGKSRYINLPIWDINDLGKEDLAILLVEGDDGNKNDVISCNDNVNIADLAKSSSIELSNESFLNSQPEYKGVRVTDFIGKYTAVLEIGYEKNVDTYQSYLNQNVVINKNLDPKKKTEKEN